MGYEYSKQTFVLAQKLYEEFDIKIHPRKRGWGIGSRKYLIPQIAEFIEKHIGERLDEASAKDDSINRTSSRNTC